MKTKIKVLVGVWALKIGGAETFAVNFCRFLNENGYEAYIFPILGSHDYKYFEWVQRSGIKVLTPFKLGIVDWFLWKINAITEKVFKKSSRLYLNRLYFKYINTKYNFRCFVSNSVAADEFIGQGVNLKVPYMIIEHGDYCKKIIEGHPFSKKPFELATAVICVSEWCKKVISKEINFLKIKVIYNGHIQNEIKPLKYEPLNLQNKFVFGMLGRDDPQKGWEEAIQAFKVINKGFPNTRLLLIGGGTFLSKLERKYSAYPNIVFAGRQADPQNWIQHVDIGLVLSKKYEAFGIAILDFFAQNKPVIASEIGGIPEVVQCGGKSGGVLVSVDEKGNPRVPYIIKAMESMIQNEGLRKSYSVQAEDIYSGFSFEKTGSEYLDVLNNLISKKNGPINSSN